MADTNKVKLQIQKKGNLTSKTLKVNFFFELLNF